MSSFASGNYKPADSKREEFRKYLEKSGVLDTLTKLLVTLYEEPEKPSSAVDDNYHSFLKQHIGSSLPNSADTEALKLEVEQLKEKNKDLEDEVTSLKEKLEQYESTKESE